MPPAEPRRVWPDVRRALPPRNGAAELARNTSADAATEIATAQVVEHALRHVAWLAQDDEAVQAALSPAWLAVLANYVPEPFRHLGR